MSYRIPAFMDNTLRGKTVNKNMEQSSRSRIMEETDFIERENN